MSTRSRNAQLKALEKARARGQEKFGKSSVSLGSERFRDDAIPSPSLVLDYKMGTGGMPDRHLVEVFGANGLGKTAALGYGTLANVQKMGKLPAIIAAEPIFDIDWAARFLDPELVLVQRPDNAEEAFEMIYDLVYEDTVDYILLDSLGALASKSESEGGGKKAYGISGTATAGLNAIMPRLWKNKIGMMIINQQRQAGKAGNGTGPMQFESPGGEALHHHAAIRIHLKPGKTRYTVPMGSGKDREAEVLVGRELVCTFKKNKLAINPKAARFEFFHIPTDKYPFGVDRIDDLIRACKMAGVFGNTTWIEHDAFPKGKVNGKPGLTKVINDDPEVYDRLRQEVLAVMHAEQVELRKKADAAKDAVIEDEADVEPDPNNPDGVLLPNMLQGDS